MNKCWFVSCEVAHGNNAPEGKGGQNAPIRLLLSLDYSPCVQHKPSLCAKTVGFLFTLFAGEGRIGYVSLYPERESVLDCVLLDLKKRFFFGFFFCEKRSIEAPFPDGKKEERKALRSKREKRETSEDRRNRCVKMNNAVIQPLVRCDASEELESPHILSLP